MHAKLSCSLVPATTPDSTSILPTWEIVVIPRTAEIAVDEAAGKRKVLDDGPWMISKELLAVVEFDGSKSLDEIDFSYIPIWIWVEHLPLGLTNRSVARTIGDDVGDLLEVDDDGGEMVAGRSLRLKIRLDIPKPLRRGIIVDLGEERGERWCPISYEHLPDFCYIYGVIGHVDRACSRKLDKDEAAAYSKELRYFPARRGGLLGRSGGTGSWRSGGFGN